VPPLLLPAPPLPVTGSGVAVGTSGTGVAVGELAFGVAVAPRVGLAVAIVVGTVVVAFLAMF